MRSVVVAVGAALALVAGCGVDGDSDVDEGGCVPHVVDVVSFSPGHDAGFGADELPGIVEGPAINDDKDGGSLDAVSLGVGGSIVVELGCAVVDGDGVDLIVHENAFQYAGGVNTEAGIVAVSADGEAFVGWDCVGPATIDDGVDGCAGMTPGGADEFDLATLPAPGVDGARFVRVTDRGDPGCCGAGKAGFDLDAVTVLSF